MHCVRERHLCVDRWLDLVHVLRRRHVRSCDFRRISLLQLRVRNVLGHGREFVHWLQFRILRRVHELLSLCRLRGWILPERCLAVLVHHLRGGRVRERRWVDVVHELRCR